jgi:hypothetical protein
MRKKIVIVFSVVLAIIAVIPAIAQTDAPVSLSSSVDKSTITIGDIITYSIRVTHDEDVQVALPGFGANLGQFEIRDYEPFEPKKVDGKIITEGQYTISTFMTGEFEVPPTGILYLLPNDSTQHLLKTEPIKITVESMKASEAGDIRDVKAPLEIPLSWWYRLRWVVIGISGLLVIAIVILLIRRHKAGKSLLPIRETPPRPAHEIALEALDRLTASDLMDKEQVKAFYIDLSEIIREYIGRRYFVVALEMTTTEVLDGLKRVNLSNDIFQMFKNFLDRSDLVKFAKNIPSTESHQETVQMAYDLVHQTKAVEVVESVAPSEDKVEDVPVEEETEDVKEVAE